MVHTTTTIPIVVPPTIDATTLTAFNKDIKARRIILDAVKDHVIPHISSKTRKFQMWDALTSLFQISNENRKMVLREKLKSIKIVRFLSFKQYDLRILFERITYTTINHKRQ